MKNQEVAEVLSGVLLMNMLVIFGLMALNQPVTISNIILGLMALSFGLMTLGGGLLLVLMIGFDLLRRESEDDHSTEE